MEIEQLSARTREGRGKSHSRKVRNAGWIPAVCYGHGYKTKALEVDFSQFLKLDKRQKTGHLIELNIENEENVTTIVKEVQRHVYKNDTYIHIDFQHIRKDEEITIDVNINLEGSPIGVKTQGGLLEHPTRTVSVKCLPEEIPENITVDITNLELGQSIQVKDLDIPDNIEILSSEDDLIASVVQPKMELETEEEEGAEEEALEGETGSEDSEGTESESSESEKSE